MIMNTYGITYYGTSYMQVAGRLREGDVSERVQEVARRSFSLFTAVWEAFSSLIFPEVPHHHHQIGRFQR